MYFVFGLAEDTSYPLTVESALTQMLEGAAFSLVFICKETGAVQISPRSEPSVFVTSSFTIRSSHLLYSYLITKINTGNDDGKENNPTDKFQNRQTV